MPAEPTPTTAFERPATRRFRLLVEPATAGRAWRALLIADDGGLAPHLSFASPTALARYLARVCKAGVRRGIR